MSLSTDEKDRLARLLENLHVRVAEADSDHRTVMSLSRAEGKLLLRAFNVRVTHEMPAKV